MRHLSRMSVRLVRAGSAAVLLLALLHVPSAASAQPSCEPLSRRDVRSLSSSGEDLANGIVPLGERSEEQALRYWYRFDPQPAGLAPLGEVTTRNLRIQALVRGTVHVLVEWRERQTFPIDQTDIDLYVDKAREGLIASSMVYNPFPEPLRTVAEARDMEFGSGDGGPGWEYVKFDAQRCTGYLIRNYPWSTEEAHDVTVSVWLSR